MFLNQFQDSRLELAGQIVRRLLRVPRFPAAKLQTAGNGRFIFPPKDI